MPSTSKLIAGAARERRASTAQLARLVGRSRTSVQSRIERLERQGVIVGYGVRWRPSMAGRGARPRHDQGGAQGEPRVTAALRAIEQVRVLHSVSGDVDLIAVAATASVAEMDQVIDRIGALDGVERTTSSIILSTKFERRTAAEARRQESHGAGHGQRAAHLPRPEARCLVLHGEHRRLPRGDRGGA
jgi:DNA-binding Lrp family transcriptional regulator